MQSGILHCSEITVCVVTLPIHPSCSIRPRRLTSSQTVTRQSRVKKQKRKMTQFDSLSIRDAVAVTSSPNVTSNVTSKRTQRRFETLRKNTLKRFFETSHHFVQTSHHFETTKRVAID